jgi:hypothetical protein
MSAAIAKGITSRRRVKFEPDEDAKLRNLVAIHGPNAWHEIAKKMGNRNPRQCRERWKHYLSRGSGHPAWTDEEDQLLWTKVLEFGQRWTKLVVFFPGRSDIQIKSRWAKKFKNIVHGHQMPMKEVIAQPIVENEILEKMSVNEEKRNTSGVSISNEMTPFSLCDDPFMSDTDLLYKWDDPKSDQTDDWFAFQG